MFIYDKDILLKCSDKKVEKLIKKIEENNPVKEIKISIDIEPEPFSRPRSTRFGNHHYNPRDKYYRALKKEYEKKFKGMDIIGGPVEITTEVYITPPKYILESKVKSEFARLKLYQPAVRPDLDNYEKASTDCLEKYTMKDDGQIVKSTSVKYYAVDRPAGIDITLRYRQDKIKFI